MPGLGASLVTFSPNTLIKSSDVNNNFAHLNNANTFTGTVRGNADTATNSTNATALKTAGGATGASVDSGGTVTLNKSPLDANGNLFSAAVKASGSAGAGGTTIAHGWQGGVIPTICIAQPVASDSAPHSCATNGQGITNVTVYISNPSVAFSLLTMNPHAFS